MNMLRKFARGLIELATLVTFILTTALIAIGFAPVPVPV